jgi:DNA-directed RNA polymerase specialized sigma subunit
MNAKDYLSQYRHMVWLEHEIEDEIDALRTRYIGKAITYSDMPTAHNSERDLSDYAAQLEDLLIKLQRRKEEAIAVYQSIDNLIEQVKSDRERELLRLRYIKLRTWEEIADALMYDVRHIHRIHGEALQSVQDVMECHDEMD